MVVVQAMEALGNEFILIDAISQKIDSEEELKLLKICAKEFSFDQLLFLEPPTQKHAHLKLKIYNVDGSLAENCVNGIRALALYAFDESLVFSNTFILQIEDNLAQITRLQEKEFAVKMSSFKFTKSSCAIADSQELQFNFEGTDIKFYPVSVGNPHAVIFQDILSDQIPEMGLTLQESNIYKNGVNVGFVKILNEKEINLRVVERGVGETLACGSGACAAVLSGVKNNLLQSSVLVNFKKGKLKVEVNLDEEWFNLIGEAKYIEKGIKINP